MKLLKAVLVDKLLRRGITVACGKPVEEASIEELQDEWARYEMQRNPRRSA
ncbi:hypothetical protein ACTID9_00875 [Brevibacillus fluminis]|uniref:hypothetical protein n=1 Tax=Brevibacillus fluminis TaxID=511487 RepID=UPI003F8B294D